MSVKLFSNPQYITVQGRSMRTSFVGDMPNLETGRFVVQRFTGFSIGRAGLIDQDFSRPVKDSISVDGLRDSLGEWIAVAARTVETDQEFIIMNDSHGFCPIFYAITPKSKIIISDTFQGVVSGLSNHGVERTLNLEAYISTIVSESPQFMNSSSNSTMAEQINIVPSNSFLYIRNNKVAVINKLNQGDLNYDELVQEGVRSTSIALRLLSEAPNADYRLTLSGGVDSRLNLALLSKAQVEERFRVDSRDPRKWSNPNSVDVVSRDIDIANKIRSDLDMQWWYPGDREMISIDFLESLRLFQRYRSNYSYTFRPSSTHSMYSSRLVSIRGGGGEVLKTVSDGRNMALRFALEGGTPQASQTRKSDWLSEMYLKRSLVTEGYRNHVKRHVDSSFALAEGQSFEEQLNSHYFNYRNRAHFGHGRYSQSANDLSFHPLSSSFFLRASRLITFSERSQGKLVKDIFGATDRKLLSYPFEDSAWTKRLSSPPLRDGGKTGQEWRESYDSAQQMTSKVGFRAGWERGVRGEYYEFSQEQSSVNYVRHAFSALESLVAVADEAELAEQHSLIIQAIIRKQVDVFSMVAKAASALDVFHPQPVEEPSAEFDCAARDVRDDFASRPVVITPLVPSDGWHNVPIFEQNPKITRDGDSFYLSSNPSAVCRNEMVYAFYLIMNGKKIAQRWYENSDKMHFANHSEPGEYWGTVFARHHGTDAPTYQMNTKRIIVS